MNPTDKVSIAELKALAARHLDNGSIAKQVILSEDDLLPWDEAVVKSVLFIKLLHREIGGRLTEAARSSHTPPRIL